jgi:renal tumor antigen
MVFELMDCNVYELINDHKCPFDGRTTIILSYQLLSAIAFVHSHKMFHRDVKPENCMVNRETMELKLADFGSTGGIDSQTAAYTEYVSTSWYRAPECILTSGSYGPEVDEWAVGCMIYELLTARPLFPGRHEVDQIARIHSLLGTPTHDVLAQFSQNPNTQISLSFAPRAPQDFHKMLPNASDALVDLMLRLLTYNPADRIAAANAVEHPAFAEVRECERTCEPGVPLSYFFLSGGRVARPTIIPHPKVSVV